MLFDELKVGDLIFFHGNDRVSKIIRYYTWGPSHVGIVVNDASIGINGAQGNLVLLESTTMCPTPCLRQGIKVDGIQVQDIKTRIAQYGTAPDFLQLRDECNFCPQDAVKFHHHAKQMIGKKYDIPAALVSATNILKYLVTPDIETLFCSALVARLLMLMNLMNWKNPEIYTPAGLRQTLLKTAVYREA